jgi:hypothetical protein
VEIVNGLTKGERIVVSATFLVDSESRLQSAAAKAPVTLQRDHDDSRPIEKKPVEAMRLP